MEGIQHRLDCPTRTAHQPGAEVTVSTDLDALDGYVVTVTRCRFCGRSAWVRQLPPGGTLHE